VFGRLGFENVRVLILGGTGFVGPFIVQQLVEAGHDVTVFHRGGNEPPHAQAALHVHGEFARLGDYVPELARRRPEVVVDVSPGIGKAGHGMRHFTGIAARGVVLTSMDVYRAMSILWGGECAGPIQPMPVTEDSGLRTSISPHLGSDLAFDNLDVERAMNEQAAELPVTVLRCPVIYGPRDTQRRLRHYVRPMDDRRDAIVLDARVARLRISRGYVENIARAVALAVAEPRAAGRTYNVAEVDALSEADWVRAIGESCSWDGEIVVAQPALLPEELRVPLPAQNLYADTSRIRRELDYQEPIARDAGLRRAVEWERVQQEGEPKGDYSAEDAALRHVRDARVHGA
jgi:nucleoside-diphosphate-sugar epimerase